MRIERKDTDIEKKLLIAMIMSTSFLKKMVPVFKKDYLNLPSAMKVAEWCIDHFQKYSKAPMSDIQGIYEEKRRRMKESDQEWIADFLAKLSRRYEAEGLNEEYLFDRCVAYFKRSSMNKSAKKVQDLIDQGKDDEAAQLWQDSLILPESDDLGVEPFELDQAKKLFEREAERTSLGIGIPTLDHYVGKNKSGWLVVFLGPMKRGKTQALVHVAVLSFLKGFNTVYMSLETEAGDMAKRFWMNVGTLSWRYPKIEVPYYTPDGKIKYHEKEYPMLNKGTVVNLIRKMEKAPHGRLFLKSFPMGQAGLRDVKNYVNLLEVYKGIQPHVIIVDYLGAMKVPRSLIGRDSEYNVNSMGLKALAQEKKAIVYTGHQGTRETLDKISMKASDASQEVRILANLDVMYGLNQRPEEKKEGIMRLNVLMHRHANFNPMTYAKILQQFEIGKFALDDMRMSKKDAEFEVRELITRYKKDPPKDGDDN